MKPKRNYLTVIILFSGILSLVHAQQRPYYTQYVLNPFISNPALAGIENYWDVKISYRNQWTGITGAPSTIYATAHGPFKITSHGAETTGTVHPQNSGNSLARAHKQQYRAIASHGGLGFTVLTDRAGPIDMYSFNAAYAYHISLSSKASLSAGLSAGAQGVNVHTDQLNFGATNPNDPAVAYTNQVSKIKPDLSFGLWLYSAFYFIGISGQNIIPSKIDYSQNTGIPTTSQGLLVPHASFTAGYKFFLNDKINFLPSAMIRFVQNTPFNFDINAKFQYREIAWVGMSYRHSQNFAAMIGMNINSKLNFGYSYDIVTSRLNTATNGTHEIVVGILLGNRNRVVLSPRNFW